MNIKRRSFLPILFLLNSICPAQTSESSPEVTSYCLLGGISGGIKLSHNAPATIASELKDSKILLLITRHGLRKKTEKDAPSGDIPSKEEMAGIHVSIEKSMLKISSKSSKSLDELREGIMAYARMRLSGHTKEFILAALETRGTSPDKITDPDLRAIAAGKDLIPVTWLKKEKAGKIFRVQSAEGTIDSHWTNDGEAPAIPDMKKVIEVRRRVDYTLTDGDIGWRYSAHFESNGTLADFDEDMRFDAKETDPKYRKIIDAVESEVQSEMKKQGVAGLGSCHTFWLLKKEKLKAQGIAWRSPSDLNPNTCFD